MKKLNIKFTSQPSTADELADLRSDVICSSKAARSKKQLLVRVCIVVSALALATATVLCFMGLVDGAAAVAAGVVVGVIVVRVAGVAGVAVAGAVAGAVVGLIVVDLAGFFAAAVVSAVVSAGVVGVTVAVDHCNNIISKTDRQFDELMELNAMSLIEINTD